MEQYLVYLFYIAVILLLGIFLTALSAKIKVSNILFLIFAGYILNMLGLNYFNEQTVLVLSSLALILIVLETTMELDLKHILKNFFQVMKFTLLHFLLSGYIMTLLVFLVFDIPGKGFEVFVMCFLLSMIIYGTDPVIVLEFFKKSKSKIHEMLEIEGVISGPIVVVFAFFVINYLNRPVHGFSFEISSQLLFMLRHISFAMLLGVALAFLLYKFIRNFEISEELFTLLVLSTGIAVFVASEGLGSNGGLGVAVYGLFLRGLIKKNMPKRFTSMFAHMLYIIVFVLLGIEMFFPSLNQLPGIIGLFFVYIMLRFICIVLTIKKITLREKLFMTFNMAKGIEIAIVLFVMRLNFSGVDGINIIMSIGFMFFLLSYIISTLTNHFGHIFLEHRGGNKKTRAPAIRRFKAGV
jgi:NhaP-type Na+/H+ or K+/H+ antiporter